MYHKDITLEELQIIKICKAFSFKYGNTTFGGVCTSFDVKGTKSFKLVICTCLYVFKRFSKGEFSLNDLSLS